MAKMSALAAKANSGSKHSEATLAKFKTRSFTAEQRAKISEAAKLREAKARELRAQASFSSTAAGSRIPILVTDVITGETKSYLSLSSAGKEMGVSKDTVKKYLESGDLFRETYIFTKQDNKK